MCKHYTCKTTYTHKTITKHHEVQLEWSKHTCNDLNSLPLVKDVMCFKDAHTADMHQILDMIDIPSGETNRSQNM